MSELLSLLQGALTGRSSEDVGRAIGADPARTQTALAAALPLLLAGLARNANHAGGADALHGALQRDHDGGVLDNPQGLLGGASGGNAAGILGHVFGAKEPAAREAVARAGGIDAAQAGKLLLIAAPLVMGALGRIQRDKNLDANALEGYLGGEHAALAQSQPGLLGMLDQNHDGNVVDDLTGMVGKLFRA